jgi:hypothetical protein
MEVKVQIQEKVKFLVPMLKRYAVRRIAPRILKFDASGGELSVSLPTACLRRKTLRFLLDKRFVRPH